MVGLFLGTIFTFLAEKLKDKILMCRKEELQIKPNRREEVYITKRQTMMPDWELFAFR